MHLNFWSSKPWIRIGSGSGRNEYGSETLFILTRLLLFRWWWKRGTLCDSAGLQWGGPAASHAGRMSRIPRHYKPNNAPFVFRILPFYGALTPFFSSIAKLGYFSWRADLVHTINVMILKLWTKLYSGRRKINILILILTGSLLVRFRHTALLRQQMRINIKGVTKVKCTIV